jgi:hypothetical protein
MPKVFQAIRSTRIPATFSRIAVVTIASLFAVAATPPNRVAVATKLIIWPKVAGSTTGASMRLAIDGNSVGSISNLSKQEMLDMGTLTTGMHQYELSSITGYGIDQAGNATKVNDGNGKCSGQFVVQAYQTYYFVMVGTQTGSDFQCRIQ